MRLTLAVTAFVALLAVACIDLSNEEPQPFQLVAETVITCLDCQLVDVTGIIDGDTIDTSSGRVRFYGIDTPERGDAKRSRSFLVSG
jgi:endonuclease YncB( thermonuclease family)